MSDARDELRGTLANTICNAANYPRDATPRLLGRDMSEVLDKTTDAILAAGYRKPRQIATVEELDALAVGSIIHMSNTKAPFLFTGDGWESTRTNPHPAPKVNET